MSLQGQNEAEDWMMWAKEKQAVDDGGTSRVCSLGANEVNTDGQQLSYCALAELMAAPPPRGTVWQQQKYNRGTKDEGRKKSDKQQA